MNNFYKISLVLVLMLAATNSLLAQKTTRYKCMIQMTNYMGDGAYIAVSLINSKDAYEKTLYVMGSDKKWYPDIKEWHKFYAKNKTNISAVTGASVADGDRGIVVLEIEDTKLNAGYKLRFETAVEDKGYHVKDAEVELTTAGIAAKTEGTGFIRYVRLVAN